MDTKDTIRVNTKPYGWMEVDRRQKVFFPMGLFGFEEEREFVLLDSRKPPFYWLQSLSCQDTAFVLIDPLVIRSDYQTDLATETLEELGLEQEDPLLFTIVTIKDNLITANLQGPLLINKTTRVGCQFISPNDNWRTRHNILEEMASQKK